MSLAIYRRKLFLLGRRNNFTIFNPLSLILNKDVGEAKNSFRFRDWPVYKDARTFRVHVIQVVKKFPPEEKYALSDQTRRALNSILLNLAEGANKNTDKDTRLFVNRSHCSLDEVVSCADCALDDGYITEAEHKKILAEADALAKQLKGFSVYLSHSMLVRVSDSRKGLSANFGIKPYTS